ncbi:GTP pyrophosphokinase family protein [Paenarthrobacter ilicis]|uniref:GTP pyrophosphokinase n=1 Tax=Paenarthrobacter ilicis TaxID=43665 RepID=UPI00386724AA
MTNLNPEQWGARYSQLRPTYVAFAERLRVLIDDLLRAQGLDFVQLEIRVKSVESFIEKINRKARSDGDPLQSITDLIGARIITYYLEDVSIVGDLIDREFVIDKNNSDDKLLLLSSDQFGYRSAHHVAILNDKRSALAEWLPYSGYKVEFQVRTALQHAWAAVSHKLDYKSVEDAPDAVRRRLFRLSALFELADEQFAIIRDSSDRVEVQYQADVDKGELNVPVDSSSLEVYLNSSSIHEALSSALSSNDWTITNDQSPVEPDRIKRDRSDLLKVLKQNGFNTLEDLDRYLSDKERFTAIIRLLTEQFSDDGEESMNYSIEDALTQAIVVDFDDSEEPGRPVYTAATSTQFKKVRKRVRDSLGNPSGTPISS